MKPDSTHLSIRRLERISDIFYAFTLLLLIYTFADVPDNLSSSRDLWDFYLAHLETFTSFAVSFLIVAYYWINHQDYFKYFISTDKTHTFIELFYLMILVFMPFMNRFYDMYLSATEPRILLSVDMVVLGLLQYAAWSYGSKNRRLIEESNPSETEIISLKKGMLIMPILAVVAALATQLSPYLWEVILVVGPLVIAAINKMKSKRS